MNLPSRFQSLGLPLLGLACVLAVVSVLFSVISKPEALEVHGCFAGAVEQDFGRVRLAPEQIVELPHVFRFRNVSDHRVRLTHVSTNCGCTFAKASATEVAPGEWIEISTVLSLSSPSLKTTTATLDLGPDGTLDLHLQAVGIYAHQLLTTAQSVRLKNGSGGFDLIWTNLDSDTAPELPQFDHAEGVEVRTGEWLCVRPRNSDLESPSRWQIPVEVKLVIGKMLPPHANLAVSVKDCESIRIAISE